MKIHFIGIGGIGISTVAQYCQNRGDIVTGSDQQETEITPLLRQKGIPVSISQAKENVPKNCDLIVYSEAVPETNPERQEGYKRNIRQWSYFRFLGEISKDFRTIAVAGTHGKTTTCGMIAAGSLAIDFDATFFVGSTFAEFQGSNFYQGSNGYAVVEACEYRENFRFLEPEIVVLTNVEWDHPDYYTTEDDYYEAFKSFLSKAKTIIYHQDDEQAHELVHKTKAVPMPIPDQDKNAWKCMNIHEEHNQRNATLALGLAQVLELDIERFKQGLEKFIGAGRRQEFLGEKNGIQIFDDYGHHPTEIRMTLEGFRAKYPEAKIGLIYEPHQFSRTRAFFDEFCTELDKADFLGLFPIYEARDTEDDKREASLEKLMYNIPGSEKIETAKEVDTLLKKLSKNDILIFMGAGKISGFAHEYVKSRTKAESEARF